MKRFVKWFMRVAAICWVGLAVGVLLGYPMPAVPQGIAALCAAICCAGVSRYL